MPPPTCRGGGAGVNGPLADEGTGTLSRGVWTFGSLARGVVAINTGGSTDACGGACCGGACGGVCGGVVGRVT